MLRHQGHTAFEAMESLYALSSSQENALLFRGGINYNDLPARQKRSTGLFWEVHAKMGLN
ncbi:MAG: hypothetical protein ACLGPL_12025 [Acidobacteriota bacterium]